jgi:enoyl-CoA hydratase
VPTPPDAARTAGGVSIHDDPSGVRRVRLERADRRNALDSAMLRELLAAVTAAPEPVALVLQAAGPTFCAGIDLDETGGADDESLRAFFESVQDVLDALRRSTALTVAAVRGAAVGAGADLALACDIRIGGPGSSFRFPGPQFGAVLGTRRLAEVAGGGPALLATVTHRRVPADEACRWGLLTELAADDDEVIPLAESVARGAAGLPPGTVGGLVGQVRGSESPRDALRRSLTPPGIAERVAALRARPVRGR